MTSRNGTPAETVIRISNSFSDGEVKVMDFILTTMLRGGDPRGAVRSKDFASLCRKVQQMKDKAAKKAKEQGREITPLTLPSPEEESSGVRESGF